MMEFKIFSILNVPGQPVLFPATALAYLENTQNGLLYRCSRNWNQSLAGLDLEITEMAPQG